MGWEIDNHERLFGHPYRSWAGRMCDVCTANAIMKMPSFSADWHQWWGIAEGQDAVLLIDAPTSGTEDAVNA